MVEYVTYWLIYIKMQKKQKKEKLVFVNFEKIIEGGFVLGWFFENIKNKNLHSIQLIISRQS